MRVYYFLAYVCFIVAEVIRGSITVCRTTFLPVPTAGPAIVEFALRCRSDLEIASLASSITITPGTLVVGVAAADDERPATLFVHSLFNNDPDSVLVGLRGMEDRLLRVTRGKEGPC